MDGAELWLTKRQEGGNFEIGRILHLKFETEILDWTDYRADWPVHSEISSFEFEMQDSSNFKFPS